MGTFIPSLPLVPSILCDDPGGLIWSAVDVMMAIDVTYLTINNANVHFSGMGIDSAVIFECCGVESHEGPFWHSCPGCATLDIACCKCLAEIKTGSAFQEGMDASRHYILQYNSHWGRPCLYEPYRGKAF